MSKKNKPLGYTLGERKVGIGPNKGNIVIQATPSGRHRVSFERFCELVAKDTTLNYMEVQSVLNLAADMARDIVANGDIVDFGRLGTLSPSFKSKVVPQGTEFNANIHITEPRVNLRPNPTYFRLRPEEVSYERMAPRVKKEKKDQPQDSNPPSGGSSGTLPDAGL
ncbi:MAG: DNA-binding protein [Porphyromonadaceae bacterium]|nr:DNA-binding protein [Porphyromonadaceae bacterium]